VSNLHNKINYACRVIQEFFVVAGFK